ncbi:MAG: hypothetical protein J4428_02415 [Candidatus Aenigmarchaeota archaeon]|nr:hypothetical protein [Candidatus Aenigmarchaeota archaeon]
MDDKETIKLFLEKGFQISKDALPLVVSEPHFIIEEMNRLNPRPFIITQDHINKIKIKSEKLTISILKTYFFDKKQLKIDEFAKSYVIKYEKISKIIQENNNLERLISINKINPKTTEFSIIGIIRDKLQNQLLVEDMTGEIEIYFESKLKDKIIDIDSDDVLGLKCRRIDSKFYLENIYYPDVRIDRNVNRLEKNINMLFLPDGFVNFEVIENMKIDFYFYFDKNELFESIKNNELMTKLVQQEIHQPTLININNLKILFLPKIFYDKNQIDLSSHEIEKLLKRRFILPKNNKLFNTDKSDFVLTDLPDIVITNIEPHIYKNYKGTSIISVSDYKIYNVNLKSREVVLIE